MISGLLLEPMDTWCFGDGTPFAGGGTVIQGGWGGLFPPYPPTVVGAVRVALARSQGWDGRGRWDEELRKLVGDGPYDTGQLQVKGVFVTRQTRPMIPVPLDIFGTTDLRGSWQPRQMVTPGPPLESDIGPAARVPELPNDDDATPGAGVWVDLAAVMQTQTGAVPTTVRSSGDLWSVEHRVGIRRDPSRHSVEEGALFAVRHVRPAPDTALAVWLDGIDEDILAKVDGMVVPFGGEGRAARVSRWEWEPPDIVNTGGYTKLTLITPARLPAKQIRGEEPVVDSARVVSACIGGAPRIGGWNSLAGTPIPLNSYLPAGSVLFIDREVFPPGAPFAWIGSDTSRGFGLAVVGTWNEQGDTQ